MPVPAVYGMGHALMGEAYKIFQKCGDVELENLAAALPEHCTVWFWRREGHSNLSAKDFGRGRRWGGACVFRLGGVAMGNPEKICAEENVG